MSRKTTYTDLELDNIFGTSGIGWKQESRRTLNGRVYDFRIIRVGAPLESPDVHVIKDQTTIEEGKQEVARYCVANLGGRPRDLTNEEKGEARMVGVEEKLEATQAELAALKKASAPPEGDTEPKPAKKKGGRPKNEPEGDTDTDAA